MRPPYEVSIRDDVAVLTLDRGKGNAIDGPLFDAMHRGLDEAEAALPCGLILTGANGFFSVGLNLVALQPLDRPALLAFMGRFREMFLRLLEFPARTVAAVNGHAVAGGALLACTCDHRVGAEGSYKMGVAETALGVGLPRCAMETLRRVLAPDVLEEVTVFGRLYTPGQALERGLLTALVPPGDLLDAAMKEAVRDREVPRAALAQVRRGLVAPWTTSIRGGGNDEDWVDTWFSDEARKRVAEAVARLTS
jgi:enoyl-CoA hydratase